MARCEDFPCCGHELGCCPNYDEGGRQLDMVCTCGKRLPIDNGCSICDRCLRAGDEDERYYGSEEDDDRYCPESERDNEESAEEADARWHDEMDLDMFSEEE